MLEKHIRKISKTNQDKQITYYHFISILVKLIITAAITLLAMNIIENNIDILTYKFNSSYIHSSTFTPIDFTELNHNTYIILIVILIIPIVLIINLIDLLAWSERGVINVCTIMLTDYFWITVLLLQYSKIELWDAMKIALLEPTLYIFILLLAYRKYQYRHKIYYKLMQNKEVSNYERSRNKQSKSRKYK